MPPEDWEVLEPDEEVGPVLEIDETHGLSPKMLPLGPPPHLLAADTFAPDDPSDLEQHFFWGPMGGPVRAWSGT